jgi:hypothetical protein
MFSECITLQPVESGGDTTAAGAAIPSQVSQNLILTH